MAKVSVGKVTALKAGVTTVVARSVQGGITARCDIVVTDALNLIRSFPVRPVFLVDISQDWKPIWTFMDGSPLTAALTKELGLSQYRSTGDWSVTLVPDRAATFLPYFSQDQFGSIDASATPILDVEITNPSSEALSLRVMIAGTTSSQHFVEPLTLSHLAIDPQSVLHWQLDLARFQATTGAGDNALDPAGTKADLKALELLAFQFEHPGGQSPARIGLKAKLLPGNLVDGVAVSEGFVNPPVFCTEGQIPSDPLASPFRLISLTPGAEVHYTLDGSEPTERSPVAGVVTLSGSTTVKAACFGNGRKSTTITRVFSLTGAGSFEVLGPGDRYLTLTGVPNVLAQGSNFSVSVASKVSYESYQWLVDGDPVPGDPGSTLSIGAALAPGLHSITAIATLGGLCYSTTANFTVE